MDALSVTHMWVNAPRERTRHMLVSISVRCQHFCKHRRRDQTLSSCYGAWSARLTPRKVASVFSMAPKRKAEKGETSGTPEKKPRAKKEKPLAEPHTGDDGWTVVPPSLLFK